MRLIAYELIKFFNKKLILFLVPLLMLANVFLYYQQEIKYNEYVIYNIIATHVVPDVEFIAKEIILIKEGKLLLQDKPGNILEDMQGKVFEVSVSKEMVKDIQKKYKVSNISSEKDSVCVRFISDKKPEELNLRNAKPSLDDVYLYMFDDEVIST
ncbi:hypothetical protein RBH29_02710 [Herbivorax sp. ANBcel31]|uniref:hypothetical protein n=1 Tax=Herbivorax sp. ANBcel31 TaxID=3069754 RepID=UPI0027B0D0A8|nr:hypothetical protein [Herbivorax sp. ANBcel31]MDQ2085349.1 hypothetical protein [Herbivorax sp. ANBcel31]